jgi:hypothetical protein
MTGSAQFLSRGMWIAIPAANLLARCRRFLASVVGKARLT